MISKHTVGREEMTEFYSYDFTNKHKVYLNSIIVKNCVKFEIVEHKKLSFMNERESFMKERESFMS